MLVAVAVAQQDLLPLENRAHFTGERAKHTYHPELDHGHDVEDTRYLEEER